MAYVIMASYAELDDYSCLLNLRDSVSRSIGQPCPVLAQRVPRRKSCRAGHRRGIARGVTNGAYDDFVAGNFVENKVRVGRSRHAPHARIAGLNADKWAKQKKVYDGLGALTQRS
jgi:hypothetical protein